MKTCEEYVLNELKITKQKLSEATVKIKELETPKERKNTDIEKEMKCIYLSDKPNYYYYVSIEGSYNYNEFLKQNNLTPDFIEKCLKDEKMFKKFCNLEKKGNYINDKIAKIEQKTYNFLLKTRNGNLIIILSSDDLYSYEIDKEDGNLYSKEEDAIRYMNKKVKENIELYFKFYKDKFEIKEEN